MERMRILEGDCRAVLDLMPSCSVDAIVTDPPYELGFMGKAWDNTGIANDMKMWAECLRVLKPGGHLLSFGGSRTYHRMACAIEDSGFEIRDQIMWVYGSGMPKSHNLKGDWEGFGTALKPSHEPICMARKPIEGTVAANVLKWGTGAINVDGCRVEGVPWTTFRATGLAKVKFFTSGEVPVVQKCPSDLGRWPANLIHDGSDEVLEVFPNAPGQQGDLKETGRDRPSSGRFGNMGPPHAHKARRDGEPSADRRYTEEGSTNFAVLPGQRRFDAGSAARFFYCAKTSKAERELGCEDLTLVALAYGNQAQAEVKRGNTEHTGKSGINTVKMRGNNHPTVKPLALMQYLCRLVTPPGGVILDPFAGSGSTGLAAMREGFDFIGIELNPEYIKIARARLLKEFLS